MALRRLTRPAHLAWFLLLASCVAIARGDQPQPEPARAQLGYDFAALMGEDPLGLPGAPAAGGPFEAVAPPYRLADAEGSQADRATDCLTAALYYEARSEGEEGQRAVAQVVLNRVRHRDYPSTVCGVVYQHHPGRACQFSFTCDGSMRRRREPAAWAEARRLAAEALAGSVYAPVGLATHYHTHAVRPGWGRRLAQVTVVGAHIFYRSRAAGGWREGFIQRSAAPAQVAETSDPVSPVAIAAAEPAEPGFAFLIDSDAPFPPPAASAGGGH